MRGQAQGARGRLEGGRARQESAAGRCGEREAHGVGARGARLERACARRLGVLAGQLGQVGAQCTWLSSDSVFLDPVRLGIFPESLNEHCSL